MSDLGSSLVADEGEVLDDGLSSSTPDGDNVLNDFARLEASAFQELAEAAGGRVEHGGELALTDSASPSVFGNVAYVHGLVADPAALADRLHAFYGGRPGGPALLFSVLPTPDLTPYGLQRVGHPPLMLLEPGRPRPGDPSGFTVAEVTSAEELALFERTLVEAYPVPECEGLPAGSLLGPPAAASERWTFLIGYLDGEPVATAAAFVGSSLTTVEFVSSRPEVRGRGVGAAITAAAGSIASDRPTALISSDLGRPVYERLGYRTIMRFTLWVVPRG
jgi:hypothetical protein